MAHLQRKSQQRLRLALLALGASAAALLFAGMPDARAEHVWQGYTFNADPNTAVLLENKMIEELAEATSGDVKIVMHPGGSLSIASTNITAAVSDDVVQFADDSLYLGSVPISGVLRLPFLVHTAAEYQKIRHIVLPYITEQYAKRGVTVLCQYAYPMQVIWSRDRLVRLADLRGKKIRITAPEQGEFIKRFGGIPVTMGPPEIPSALDRGVVSGVLTATSGAGYSWRDLLKSNYRIGININDALLVVNTQRLEELPAQEQEKVRTIIGGTCDKITSGLERAETELTNKLIQAGMVVTPADPADIDNATKTMTPYWDDWAKQHGPLAGDFLTKIRAELGR